MTTSHIGVMASTGEEANRASLDLWPLLLGMSISPEWVHEPEAAKLLAIKSSTLRNMRRERRLDAGTHWVYATGSIGGPVVYCIPAIREMQIQRTKEHHPSCNRPLHKSQPDPVEHKIKEKINDFNSDLFPDNQ